MILNISGQDYKSKISIILICQFDRAVDKEFNFKSIKLHFTFSMFLYFALAVNTKLIASLNFL